MDLPAQRVDTDVQTTLFQGSGVTLCRFRCPPDHERWRRENQIVDGHNLAFPRRSVTIRRPGAVRRVIDPNQCVFYNHGERYERGLLSADGDRSEVFLFRTEHVVAALREHDAAVIDRRDAPFRLLNGPVDSRLYLRQSLLAATAGRSPAPDPLRVVEESLGILADAVGGTYRADPGRAYPRGEAPTRAKQTDLVEQLKATLSLRFDEPIRLESLAREAEVSAFHLCRVFRRVTGQTIHAYLQQLRLRAALDLLQATMLPLVEIALAVGFSHQSHFTEAFRKSYGEPPGRLRRAFADRGPA